MPLPLAGLAWLAAGGGVGAGLSQMGRRRPWGVTEADWEKFQQAQEGGFAGGYNRWAREGKPARGVTPYTRSIMTEPEYAEAEAIRRGGGKTQLQRRKEEQGKPPVIPSRKPTTLEEAEERLAMFEQKYGAGSYYLDYDSASGEYTVKRDPAFFTEKREEARGNRAPFGFNPYDNPATPEIEGGWTGSEWAPPYGWVSPSQQGELDLREKQMEQQRLQDEAMMGWYREQAQMQQQEQERQYRSQLMANPMSWLQYASYTGQTPVVQEWMKPLMSGQYQTGQQIPGWMGGKQTEGQAMGSLPELRTPSAQLWARMGPTAQAGYMGYGQARTGIRPEESAFRLRATAPPSGRFGGLRRMR